MSKFESRILLTDNRGHFIDITELDGGFYFYFFIYLEFEGHYYQG